MIQHIACANIKKYRKQSGLTQDMVASLLNMSRTAYSQLENGNSNITLVKLEQVAEALDVPWQLLLEHKAIDTYTINSFEE